MPFILRVGSRFTTYCVAATNSTGCPFMCIFSVIIKSVFLYHRELSSCQPFVDSLNDRESCAYSDWRIKKMAFCHCFFWPLSICKIGICCTTKIGDTYWTNNGRTRANHCIYYNLQNKTHNKRFVLRVSHTLMLNGNVMLLLQRIWLQNWRFLPVNGDCPKESVAEVTLRFFLRRIRLDNSDTCF